MPSVARVAKRRQRSAETNNLRFPIDLTKDKFGSFYKSRTIVSPDVPTVLIF